MSTLAALLLGGAVVSSAVAQEYDLVINSGRVMAPEINFDSVANAGFRDGRIAFHKSGYNLVHELLVRMRQKVTKYGVKSIRIPQVPPP